MPRIHAIRLANIRYDNGRRQIHDLTITLGGDNTLLLLANGGGKTTLLHLILQATLPGCRIGPRRLTGFIQNDNYSGHILVEWILDTPEPEFLLTGIVFTRVEEAVKHYHYTHHYTEQNPFDLRKFPIVTADHRPQTCNNLRTLVNRANLPRLRWFDTAAPYRDHLTEFHLHSEEWESIRRINDTEGGVHLFFHAASTTPALLARVFVPAIDSVLHATDSERQTLRETFQTHHKSLVEIPRLQANLADFDTVIQDSDNLLNSIRRHDSAEQQRRNIIDELGQTRCFIQTEVQRIDTESAAMDAEREQLSHSLAELVWRSDSYGLLHLSQQLAEKTLLATHAHKAVEDCGIASAAARLAVAEAQVLQTASRRQRAELRLTELRTERESRNLQVPELQARATAALAAFSVVWNQENTNLSAQIVSAQQEKTGLAQNETSLQTQSKAYRAQVATALERLGEVSGFLRQHDEQHASIADRHGLAAANNPREQLHTLGDDSLACTALLDEQKGLRETAEEQTTALRDRREEVTRQIQAAKGAVDEAKKEQQQFAQEAEKITGELSLKARVFCADLTIREHATNALTQLRTKTRSLREELFGLVSEAATLRARKANTERSNVFAPHHAILDLRTHLETNGVLAQTGPEWILSLPFDAQRRQRILEQNPLLPYALVVESSHIGRVSTLLARNDRLPEDFPVLLIPRDQALEGSTTNELQGTHIVPNLHTLELVWSEDAWNLWKKNLDERLNHCTAGTENLQSDHDICLKLAARLEGFLHEWSAERLGEIHARKVKAEHRTTTLEDDLTSSGHRLVQLKAQIDRHALAEDELRKQRDTLDRTIAELENYASIHAKAGPLRSEESSLKQQLTHLEWQIGQNEDRLSEIRTRALALESTLVNLDFRKRELTMHRNETGVQTEAGVQTMAHPATSEHTSYEAALSHTRTCTRAISQHHGDLGRLDDTIATTENEHREHEEQLKLQQKIWPTLHDDWLINQRRAGTPIPTAADIHTRQQHESTSAAALRAAEAGLADAQGQVQRAEGALDNARHSIFARHGRAPFADWGENPAALHTQIQRDHDNITKRVNILAQAIAAGSSLKRAMEQALESALPPDLAIPLNDAPLDIEAQRDLRENPFQAITRRVRLHSRLSREVEAARAAATATFAEFESRANKLQNKNVTEFMTLATRDLRSGKLFDLTYMEGIFARIREDVFQGRRFVEQRIAEFERERTELIDRFLRKIHAVYLNLSELTAGSRVTIAGRSFPLLRLDLPGWPEPAAAFERMQSYLHDTVGALQRIEAEGRAEGEQRREIEQRLAPFTLLQAMIPLEGIRLQVYKPRADAVLAIERPEYARWEEVANWSGGEKYAVYMGVFMALMAHLRLGHDGAHRAWRTIVADNPFGAASSAHVLEPVFAMAERSRIQLVCLTALHDQEILRRFRVVYSLKLAAGIGGEILRSEALQQSFYHVPVAGVSQDWSDTIGTTSDLRKQIEEERLRRESIPETLF